MKRAIGAMLMAVLMAGCAARPDGPSLDYAGYLAAMERVAEMEAQVDRTIWVMAVGAEPVVLPSGTTITVRVPPGPLPQPQMFRDFAYEAELAYYGQIWSIVGGVAIPAMSSAWSAYQNRRMIEGIMQQVGTTAIWNNTGDGTQMFSGGMGDRTGDYVETTTLQPFAVDPVVVPAPAPVIVNPVIMPTPAPGP